MRNAFRAILAIVLLVGGGVTLFATPAYDTFWTYYDGPNLATANVIGQVNETCSGTTRWGTTSQYADVWYGEPCWSAPPCALTEDWACGQCNDEIDNDYDGHTDEYDPGCFT